MNHISFFPFHNRHIAFLFANGKTYSGVVVDSIDYNEKNVETEYAFIPTPSLRIWKEAEKVKDEQKMRSLEFKLDIRGIRAAKKIKRCW